MLLHLFPKKFFGDSAQPLTDERRALEKAMEIATETGQPQTVEVDGQKYVVKDPGRAGREIEPA